MNRRWISGFRQRICSLMILLSAIATSNCVAADGPGLYGGGGFYLHGDECVAELKQSGFKWLCVWTIHVMPDGILTLNGELDLVRDGKYIGNDTFPDFPDRMKKLKAAPSSIEWIEFGLSAWGSTTFDTVRDLVKKEGTAPGSTLYENFKALREAIPEIDAISFDDEKTYHTSSTTEFAVMLADLGFKVSICPYRQVDHWRKVIQDTNLARPGTITDVHLQCYAGGSANSPCKWDEYFPPEINVMPGLEDGDGVGKKVAKWNEQCSIKGAWIWLYNDLRGKPDRVKQHASMIAENIASTSIQE